MHRSPERVVIYPERTEGSAYNQMMEYVEQGLVPACVPVAIEGKQHVWTTGAEYDKSKINDELDAFALALLAVTRAYKQGDEYGLVPVL